TLARGQFYEQVMPGPLHVATSKPVLVAQYQPAGNTGGQLGFTYTAGPFMALVPSTAQFQTVYTVREITGMFHRDATLVVPAADVGTLTVDGQALPPYQYMPIADSGYF